MYVESDDIIGTLMKCKTHLRKGRKGQKGGVLFVKENILDSPSQSSDGSSVTSIHSMKGSKTRSKS